MNPSPKPPSKASSAATAKTKPPGRALDSDGRMDADEHAADTVRLKKTG